MPAMQQITVVPYTPAALKSELLGDPAGLGYAKFITADDVTGLQNLLNDPGAGSVPALPVDAPTFLTAIVASELANLTTLQMQQVQLLCSAGAVKIGDPNIQSWISQAFGSAPNSKAALAALGTKSGSRAEVLWGTGTVVPAADIENAITQGA